MSSEEKIAQLKGRIKYGLEAEFLLARLPEYTPLWYQDVSFDELNEIFESVCLEGIPSLDGLELEPPHKKLMPYIVEGYHIPDQDFNAKELWPKGVEIRTPVCQSLPELMSVFRVLYQRLQKALRDQNLSMVSLSHHPLHVDFEGPQNKRRHDFWMWAMEVMTTYGPDINVSFPKEYSESIDLKDLQKKIDYYAPALAAMSVGCPFVEGDIWKTGSGEGKSFRMHKRSVVAPPIEIHPDENWRLEFKVFDMSWRQEELESQFLSFLVLALSDDLEGRARHQERIYDLGQIARFGLEAENVRERVGEVLEAAKTVLPLLGLSYEPLKVFEKRINGGEVPADELSRMYKEAGSFKPVLEYLSDFQFS